MKDKFLLRNEAARYINEKGLPITRGTLAKLASVGGGPNYRIFGNKAVYTHEEVDAWIAKRLDMESAA